MTVKLVKTLGANPLVLMEKLAAADGLTLLQDLKVADSSGNSFAYRVVAKISDNLYIEAMDNIYNVLNSNNKAVPLYNVPYPKTGHIYSVLKQEAAEVDKTKKFSGEVLVGSLGVAADAVPTTIIGKHSMSLLATLPIENDSNYGYRGYSITPGINTLDASKVVFTGEINSGETLVNNGSSGLCFYGASRSPDTAYPFQILNAPHEALDGLTPAPTNNSSYTFSSEYAPTNLFFGDGNYQKYVNYMPIPLVVSAVEFRLATSVDSSNELVTPSTWNDLPIFTDISSDGAGLYFSVAGTRGQYLIINTVDTSKGNKMSGIFPTVYRYTPYTYNPNSIAEKQLTVVGDTSSATTEIAMSDYVPELPIANDNVTGGPVVTNIFALGTDEIRGVVPGVLACSSNLALGTIGWFDGVKYKVIKPGRMIKIG